MSRELPVAALAEVYELQAALADLLRALLTEDDSYVVRNVEQITQHRDALILRLMEWELGRCVLVTA